jgi:hypothetical protein
MPNTYIKDSGVQRLLQRPFAKVSGAWQPIKKIWAKDAGTWRQVFGNTGTETFSTVGTISWTAPPGVYSVNVTYPTTTGMVTTSTEVIPGTSYNVTIGNFGVASSFGSIIAPVFDIRVFEYSGNVDIEDVFSIKLGSPTGTSFSSTGRQATHEASATANGINLDEYGEGNHGDLTSSIVVRTVPNSVLISDTTIYYAYTSGRYQYDVRRQYPSSANNYTMIVTPNDPGSSEGYYAYWVNLQQRVPITITY